MRHAQQVKRHMDSGFTLLEVLLSIAILGIILLSFFHFFGQSLTFSNKNEAKLQAVNIARQAMNELQEKTNAVELIKAETGVSNLDNVTLSSTTDSTVMNKLLQPATDIDSLLAGQFEMLFLFHESGGTGPLVQVTVRVTSPERKMSAETYGFIK